MGKKKIEPLEEKPKTDTEIEILTDKPTEPTAESSSSSDEGNNKLEIVMRRCSPLIQRPTILNPASGTRVISIFPCAPTNKISDDSCLLRNS